VFEVIEIKKLNGHLASSAQVKVRDLALKQLQILLKEGKWFEEGQERRHSRMMWEGLFFFFWHADKMMYQREAAVKIAALI